MILNVKRWIKYNFPFLLSVVNVIKDLLYNISHPIVLIRVILVLKKIDESTSNYIGKNSSTIVSSYDELIKYADDPFWDNYLVNKWTKKMFDSKGTCFALIGPDGLIATMWCMHQNTSTVIRPFPKNFNFFKVPYIYWIMVHPRFRGQGMGGSLMNFTIDFLGNRGHKIVIGLVRDANRSSRRLLEKSGFEEGGRITILKLFGFDYIVYKNIVSSVSI